MKINYQTPLRLPPLVSQYKAANPTTAAPPVAAAAPMADKTLEALAEEIAQRLQMTSKHAPAASPAAGNYDIG